MLSAAFVPRSAWARGERFLSPEDKGARGDGRADDGRRVQAALDEAAALGVPLRLTAGRRYDLQVGLRLPRQGAHLVGEPGAALLCRGANFICTRKTHSPEGAVVLGERVARPVLEDVHISIQDVGRNGWVQGIVLRSVQAPLIRRPVIRGGNAGNAIQLDSLSEGGVIEGGYVGEWLLDRDIGFGQVTGLAIDDDVLDGERSRGIRVHGLRIARLSCSPASIAAFGDQSDGVTVLQRSRGHTFTALDISEVHEGFDIHGDDCRISDSRIGDVRGFGIKMMHGASRNVVEHTAIRRARLAGIIIAGSDTAVQNTDGNRISDVAIEGVNEDGPARNRGFGVLMDDTNYRLRRVTNTTLERLRFDRLENAEAEIRMTTRGGGNQLRQIESSVGQPSGAPRALVVTP